MPEDKTPIEDEDPEKASDPDVAQHRGIGDFIWVTYTS